MVEWTIAPPVGDPGLPPDVDSHAAAPCGHADVARVSDTYTRVGLAHRSHCRTRAAELTNRRLAAGDADHPDRRRQQRCDRPGQPQVLAGHQPAGLLRLAATESRADRPD